ncbi:MAG TPA: D-glycerate dehydrogenase [Candidatus Binataceae bacterium]|nr:D-glycerate dehydrogenase [Candidatus Binataceae bacterium]
MQPRVLVTIPLPASALSLLEKHGTVTSVTGSPDDPRFGAALAEADGILISPRIRVDRDFLGRAPRLRAVSTYSVGLDHIDLAAARERAVAVAHTPVLTDTVADLTIALILALARRMPEAIRIGASPNWQATPMGIDLKGKTLLIVGFGRIGQEVARRALACKMKIAYFDQRAPDVPFEAAVRVPELSKGLAEADFVSLNVDLNASTRHLIGREALACMKPTAFLVNTSRGAVVDQKALTEALREGRIAGAALDVLEQEPPDASDPLLRMSNVIVVPHIGSATVETRQAMLDCALDNLITCLKGEPCRFAVTPQPTPARSAPKE